MLRQPVFLFASVVSLFVLVLTLAHAQSQSQALPQPPTASAPPQTQQGQATPARQQKPVKVWTNDEVDDLRDGESVSVVGNTPSTKNVSATSKTYSQEKDPAWYRKQLIPLQAEIDRLDPQIAKTQAFLNGENVSEPASIHRQITPSVQDQLKQMEAKRQADSTKKEDLLDLARHNGILPGALR